MDRTFDDRIQDRGRLYGLRPGPAECIHKDDGSAGILVSGSGRQYGTAILKVSLGRMFSPAAAENEYTFLKAVGERKPEAGRCTCYYGVRCCGRDDYYHDGCSEEELRRIYNANREGSMDFLVTEPDLRDILIVKIGKNSPEQISFKKNAILLLDMYRYSTRYLSKPFRPVIVKGKSAQIGAEIFPRWRSVMDRTFDDRIQDRVRLFCLRPVPAERNNRKDDGSAGILVSGSGRQYGTAILKVFLDRMFSPAAAENEYILLKAIGECKPEAGRYPCCYGRDDYYHDGCSEEELRSIYNANKEGSMDFHVTAPDLKGMLIVKIGKRHPMANFFQKKCIFLLNVCRYSTRYLYKPFSHVIVKGNSAQSVLKFILNGGIENTLKLMIPISHDEQMQNIARRERGLHAALAEPFRTKDGLFGTHGSDTDFQQVVTSAGFG